MKKVVSIIMTASLFLCSAESAQWVVSSRDETCWETSEITPEATSCGWNRIDLPSAEPAQVIDGFGGCFNEMGWPVLAGLPSAERSEVMESLFGENGCRFSLCRMPIGASDFSFGTYSLNDTPGDYAMEQMSLERDRQFLLPFIKAAMVVRPDLVVWGSPWSPPAWMKESGNYKALGKGLVWTPETLSAYARYLGKAVQLYRAEGLNFSGLHVQNEPWANQLFPSCMWSGEELHQFIRSYLGPHFEQNRIDAEIWLGTINRGVYSWSVGPALDDPECRKYIDGVGLQWSGKFLTDTIRKKHPNIRIMQTETDCGSGQNDWDYAEYTSSLMYRYLAGGANSYMQWNMVLGQGHDSYWGWPQNAMVTVMLHNIAPNIESDLTPEQVEALHRKRLAGQEESPGGLPLLDTIRYNPQFYMVKHIARFVDPGARWLNIGEQQMDQSILGLEDWRERSVESEPDHILAFLNPNGDNVLVFANYQSEPILYEIEFKGGFYPVRMPAHSFGTLILN